MIRKNQHILTQLYAIADFLVIQVVFLMAWWIKFDSGWFPLEAGHLPFLTYLFWNNVFGFVSVFCGFMVGFYTPKRKKRFSFELFRIVQVHAISLLVFMSILFVNKTIHISREYLALFMLMDIGVMSVYRFAMKLTLKRLREKGYNKQFLLIVGAGSLGRRFYENLQQHPELGFEVVGFLDDHVSEHEEGAGAGVGAGAPDKPIVGKVDELERVLRELIIDEVIIALPIAAHYKYGQIITACEKAGVRTMIIPDFYDFLPARPSFDNFAGLPLINVRDIPLDDLGNRMAKRAFDIAFSLLTLLVTAPVMLLVALAIKLTSPGPVIYKQQRVGLNRRAFEMYKFRTMHLAKDDSGDTGWTVENDPRRTRLGSFLRSTSLDELPQFFNVLMGHMSVVGPRPERPYFVEQFKEEIPKYMVKHHIRPGITGWAQSNGLRGDTSIADRISHDIFYIENWTFLFDLKIIAKTIKNGFVNKNAY